MSDVHSWASKNIADIKNLIASFYDHKPEREQRAPVSDLSKLIRINGEIESALSTLKFVSKGNKFSLSDLASLVGRGDTPDNAYFGPSPSFSGAGGTAAGAGALADVGLTFVTAFKGMYSEHKYMRRLEKDSSGLKQGMVKNYSDLAILLHGLTERAAENESTAKRLHSNGLNVPILRNAWTVVRSNNWIVLAG